MDGKLVHFPLVTKELAEKVVPTVGPVGVGVGEGFDDDLGEGLGPTEGVGDSAGAGLGDAARIGVGDDEGSCAAGTKPFWVGAGRALGVGVEEGTTFTTIEACTDPRVATSRAAPGASPRALPLPGRMTFGLLLVKVVPARSAELAA